MKRSLIVILALVFVLSIACTAFAGPFADVPAKHWAYEAVSKLAKAGIVEGYGDGTFRGDRNMTRYEMAMVVARAMERSDKADAANKALIDKLAAEFAQELNTLGVRVTNLETKVAALDDKVGNMKFTGEFRFRYDHVADQRLNNSQSYLDLWANARINDDWVAKAEFETSHDGDGTEQNKNNTTTRIFATGSAFGGNLTVGKFNPFSMYGLVIDDNMTGGQFKFGNTLKARLAFGKLDAGQLGSVGQVIDPKADPKTDPIAGFTPNNIQGSSYAVAELGYALSKDSNLRVAYHRVGLAPSVTNLMSGQDKTVTYWEYGFDTKFSPLWSFFATASKSDLDIQGQDNKGYLAQIQYNAASLKQVNSYDIFYNYRKIPVLSQIDCTWDYSRGIKGSQLGVEYVPMLNSKVTVFYLRGNLVDDNSKVNVFRAQLQMFF